MNSLLTYAQENSSSSSSMFSTILAVAKIAGLWKMFEKANVPGWTAIIPFYNYYKLCEKVMDNPWYFIGLYIPIVRWYFKYQIGRATALAYGKPDSWLWGYMIVPSVFYCITGFDDSKYYGLYGYGDTRTGEARQAKTVDFDVVKNEPAAEPVVAMPAEEPAVEPVVEAASEFEMKPTEEPAKESSGEVEFDFDQSGE